MSQVCARKKDICTVVMSSLLSAGSECQKRKNAKCPYLFCCFKSVHGHVLFLVCFLIFVRCQMGKSKGSIFQGHFVFIF